MHSHHTCSLPPLPSACSPSQVTHCSLCLQPLICRILELQEVSHNNIKGYVLRLTCNSTMLSNPELWEKK